jgi:hypothetical protein
VTVPPGPPSGSVASCRPSAIGVRVLAPARFAERIAAARCEHAAFPANAESGTDHGRATEDQSPFLEAMFFGSWLADAMAGQAGVCHPGAVVAGYLLRCAASEAGARRVPLVVLIHMAYRFHARMAPVARPAVGRMGHEPAACRPGTMPQSFTARPVQGKHVHLARAEGTNDPCRLRLPRPDCW